MEYVARITKVKKETLLKYISAGTLATCLDLSLFIFLYNALHIPAGVAGTISFCVAAFLNFSLNNHFTFHNQTKSYAHKFITFYGVSLGGLIINFTVINLLIAVGFYYLLAKLTVTGIVVLYNYFLHTQVTFK